MCKAFTIIDKFYNSFENIYLYGIIDCIKNIDILLYNKVFDNFKHCNIILHKYLVEDKDRYFYEFRDCMRILYKDLNKCIEISKKYIDKEEFLIECDLNILENYCDLFDKDFYIKIKESNSDVDDFVVMWNSLKEDIKNNILSRIYRISDMGSDKSILLKNFLTKYYFDLGI